MSQSPFASPEARFYRGSIVPFRVKIVKMFRLVSSLMYIVLRAKIDSISIRVRYLHSILVILTFQSRTLWHNV